MFQLLAIETLGGLFVVHNLQRTDVSSAGFRKTGAALSIRR
jgi:hypothetical protein